MVVKDILRKMRIMENENEILKSLASGDQQVFSWLFRRYYLKVRSFAYGFVKDADEADDLAQTVFIKIWDKHEIFSCVKNFDAYLYTLTKYTIFNYIKSKDVGAVVHDEFPEILNSDTPYEELLASDLKLLIDMVVDSMSPQRKMVYILSRVRGLSNDEIAVKLGIHKKTVENHLNLALRELKNVISTAIVTYFLLMNWWK